MTKQMGRPPLPLEQKAVKYSVYLTPARLAKLKQLGATAWLNKVIDAAPTSNLLEE